MATTQSIGGEGPGEVPGEGPGEGPGERPNEEGNIVNLGPPHGPTHLLPSRRSATGWSIARTKDAAWGVGGGVG